MQILDSIPAMLAQQAAQTGATLALLAPHRSPLDYTGLAKQTAATSASLAQVGISPGDRVAIVLPNGPEMAAAFLGVASYCTAAPLNPAYRQSEYEFYLEDLQARTLIVPRGEMTAARQAATALGIRVIDMDVRQMRLRAGST